MATDRRRAAATTLTGAALLSAGGGLRHEGVRRAVDGGTYPRVHLTALKGAKRGKGLYLAGTAVGTVGAAALGSGLLNLTRRKDVDKRDKTPLWQEGVAGTADALRDRKASLTTSAPPKARGTQIAVAGGAGAVGSALARLAMRRSSGRTKALVTPIAGALAATASVPLSSRAVQRSTKGEYVVTPTGVRRAKDVIKKPSTKAHMVSSRHGPLRSQVVPSDDRFGKADSFGVQRAKITAAGSTPIVGPYAQAHLAAHYAPAGQKRKAALRQFAMGPGAGMAAGVGAAYGGAALARHHTGVGTKAESALQWRSDKVNAVRNKVGLGDTKPIAETSLRGRVLAGAKANRLAKPLLNNRGTAAAAAVGFLGTRALVSGIGGQAAISRNQRDQRAQNLAKLDIGGRREAKREKHKLADTKRLNADLATASGATNLASLGLLATRHKAKAIPLSIIGSGIGGTNALIGAHVQRREAHAIDPVKKGYLPEFPLGSIPRAAIHKTHGKVRVLAYHGDNRFTVLNRRDEKVIAHRAHLTFLPEVKKDVGADHRDLLRRYGDRGPLPKNIDRDEKMRAYEARYAAHGGKKGEKWQHRANVAEGVRNIALGTGTAALAGLAALKTKRGMAHVARHPIHQHRLDALALASGAVGGGAELYGELARDRRASYASSPGGVAASALTRMRQNTPGGAR